jgi:hypothetical protein
VYPEQHDQQTLNVLLNRLTGGRAGKQASPGQRWPGLLEVAGVGFEPTTSRL